ncbi:MAG: hypothetical protein WD079_02570, partial [Phycisphaeraceae bacterium]
DGRLAYVVATHAHQLDRPIVRLMDTTGAPLDEVIDLAAVPSRQIRVSRPIYRPGQTQDVEREEALQEAG